MVMAIIAILLMLVLVVGLHELGHALVARFFGVKIKKISIGFGKSLLSWKGKNACEWIWGMWPLGGYVELLNSRISPVEPAEYDFCVDKQAAWKRFLILIAGSVVNYILAWLFFIIVFSCGILYKTPQIQSVVPQSLAQQAGIQAGDQFLVLNGVSIHSWQDVLMQLVICWGNKKVALTLKNSSDAQPKAIELDLSQVKFSNAPDSLLGVLGLVPDKNAISHLFRANSLGDAIYETNEVIKHWLHFFIAVLIQLVSGVLPFSILLGPLGLFAASVASLAQGVFVFLYFIASFSLAVALINLFPVPGLDGGSIVYVIIEKIRGKPVSIALEVLLHRLMLILCVVILIQLLMNDLGRLLKLLVSP